MIKSFFLLIFTGCALFASDKEQVVCIHGFMGSPWNMHIIKKHLKKKGWDAIDWDYSSREHLIEEHAQDLAHDLQEIAKQNPGRPIHFVTHSMGGLVLLAALNDPCCPKEAKIGRAVLLTPPLGGSDFGRKLGEFKIMEWLVKEYSGKELTTKKNFDDLGDFPSSLKGVLVIAGDRNLNPFFKEDGDGLVAVEETYLSTAHEHATIHEGHLTILASKEARHMINGFLQDGTIN